MADRSVEAQDAVERLINAAYLFTVGVVVLFIGTAIGFLLGLFDIFIAGILLGRSSRFTINTFGEGFGRIARRTMTWYRGQLEHIAFGYGEFDPTPPWFDG